MEVNYLKQYYEEIQKGNIIVGLELKTELQKLIKDLDNPQYRYDTSESHLRIEFMENLCLQSKKPFYNVPMQLLLWEKAFIEVVYSFKFFDEELNRWARRFQNVILLIARKNGKTTLMAADGHTDLRIGEGGMDIVCASNDDKQASLLWNEIDNMRKRIDPHSRITHKNMSAICNTKKNITIFKMSSKTQNKDGRNIDKMYMDESHDAPNDEIAEAGQKSMSTKDEPLFINLTTEGFINDGYLDNELKYAREVLFDETNDIHYLPWLYTQDSEEEIWQDEQSWYKSNPGLGVVKKWKSLRGEIEKSKTSKSKRMHTLCKDFNIKQNNAQSWLMLEDYSYEKEPFNLEDFRGSFCLGAVDLSETTDLSNAKILLMKPNDKTKYVYSHYWIPESKLQDSNDKEAGAKYEEWAREGLLTIHEGNEIDISKIADWFYELYKNYGIKTYMAGYDQRFSKPFTDRMNEFSFETEMILQGKVLSNAMKLVEAELQDQKINYNKNAMDKWCLGNSAMEMDNYGNIMCVKVKNQASKRIDGAVTLIILYEVYRRYRNEFHKLIR